MRTRLLSATSPRQDSTCVTHETSNLRDVLSRLRSISRSHADNGANIGQRTYSSKAPTVRACHQWSFHTSGSISSLSAKLAHVRYLPLSCLRVRGYESSDIIFVQSRLHLNTHPRIFRPPP